MMSVLRGEGVGQPNSDQRKGGCVISVLTRGEGVQNLEKITDVICKWPLAELFIRREWDTKDASGTAVRVRTVNLVTH